MSAPDKFTPGTWRAVKPDGAPYWGIHTDAPSCTVAGTASGLCEADARLIAAAPDLLASARAAIEYDTAIRSCANSPDRMASYCSAQGDDLDALYAKWIGLSRAALARAEGRP